MGMYALGVIPLIRILTATRPQVHQVWYADDASGAGSCADLCGWWDALCSAGPNFGYHPNPSKTFLVTKPEHAEKAKQLFAGTNVSICAGKRCLGAAIGSKSFTEEYVRKKVCTWVEEVKSLACNAATHPHSAYSAFTHGLSSRWTFVSRTMSDIQNLLVPLEHAIHEYLLPALTGRPSCSSLERSYLALPVRLGGLGIANPTETSAPAFLASVKLTAPLTSMIVSTGTTEIQLDYNLLQSLKRDISSENHKSLHQKAEGIYKLLPPSLQRCFDLACEKGSSSWLSALPIADHGFHLNKGEFRDAFVLEI